MTSTADLADDQSERDPRSNSVAIAWKDWTKDEETVARINQLVQEVGISLRLSGGASQSNSSSPTNPPSFLTSELDSSSVKKKLGRPPDPIPYSDLAFRLLLNALRVGSFDSSAWLGYTRTEGDYTNRRLYPKSVTYHRVIRVVGWLADLGWLELQPGYFNYAQRYGFQSLLRATQKLLDRLDGFKVVVNQEILLGHDLVRMKDETGERVYNYALEGNVGVMIDHLKRINKQIASARLGFNLSPGKRQEMFDDLRRRRSSPDLSRIQLYRTFNDNNWEHGGRFYGGWWINMPSEYRQFITINSEPTVEPDFSAYHISMLYGSKGLPIPSGDLYDIGWQPKYRDLVKLFVNALLNASSAEKAVSAVQDFRQEGIRELWNLYADDPQVIRHGKKNGLLLPMLDAIRRKHSAIAEAFGSGEGIRLQFKDSRIAELILTHGMFENVTILPVHDSFIIPQQYAGRYEKTMKQTFEAYYAQPIKVK